MLPRIEEIIYAEQKVKIFYKNIQHSYLRVKPPGIIQVTTSLSTPLARIYQLLDKYHVHLQVKLTIFSQEVIHNELRDGSIINYLANSYVLKLNLTSTEVYSSHLIADTLRVSVIDFQNYDVIYNRVTAWYCEQGIKLANSLMNNHFSYFEARGFVLPIIAFKPMHSQWGSYSRKPHKIYLNLALLQFDIKYLEYVIAHELCHIIELNHSNRFYVLLELLLPNWRELKIELRKFKPLFLPGTKIYN